MVEAQRYAAVDILRIVSAFGIVFFHSRLEISNFREIFYAGLVCFIIISVWFAMDRRERDARQHFAGLTRVLIPWAFWSLVFLSEAYLLSDRLALDATLPWRFWAGTAIHLWYVMFLVIVLTAIWWLRRHLALTTLEKAAWIAIVVLTLTTENWRGWSMAMPAPIPQYAHAVFPILAGIVLYCDFQRGRFIGTALAMLAALYLVKFNGVGLPYLIGILLCLAAFGLSDRFSSRASAWPVLADCMFGVYLIHPLLYYPWRKVVGDQSLAYPAFVFASATAIVLLMRLQNNSLIHVLFGLRPRGPGREPT